jgi:hypothetical protein
VGADGGRRGEAWRGGGGDERTELTARGQGKAPPRDPPTFSTISSTPLSVCSRITALVSMNPVARLGKTLSRTTVSESFLAYWGRCSSSTMRMARSGVAKSLTMMGLTDVSNSPSDSFAPILRMGARVLELAPPNSRALRSSGRTLCLQNAVGSWSILAEMPRMNSSFSPASFMGICSRKRLVVIKSLWK